METSTITVSGPNEFCSTGTYSLTGSICGGTVNWSLGTLNNFPNVASLSCTNCASTTLTKINNGTALLIATLTYPNSNIINTYQKYIGVGIPVFRGWYNSPTNSVEPLKVYQRFDFLSNEVCNGAVILTSTDITANSQVTWTDGGNSGYSSWYQTGNNLHLIFLDVNQYAIFNVGITNSCGTTNLRYRFNSIDAAGCGVPLLRVSVSPNPSTNLVKVTLTEKEGLQNKKEIKQIKIVDKLGNVKQIKDYTNILEVNVDVTNLPMDIYTIMVFDGKQWYSTKFIKN